MGESVDKAKTKTDVNDRSSIKVVKGKTSPSQHEQRLLIYRLAASVSLVCLQTSALSSALSSFQQRLKGVRKERKLYQVKENFLWGHV